MKNALQPIDEIRRTIQSPAYTKELQSALPPHIKVEKFQRVVISAIQQNAQLLECNRKSLFAASMTAAQLGLYTDGFLGEAYLVPYKKNVQFQPGYRGIVKLARQSGELANISCHVVYENDYFDYELGDNESITHRPTLGERGAMQYVYAIAKFKDDAVQRVVLTKQDVMKIKKSSQAADSKYSPWHTFEEEMWKKTAIKRLCKMLPLNTDLQNAIALSDQSDIGKQANLVDDVIVVDGETGEIIKEKKPSKPQNLEDVVLNDDDVKEVKDEKKEEEEKKKEEPQNLGDLLK
jgi:recombination protein RecT